MENQKNNDVEMPVALFEVGEFVYDCKFAKGEKKDCEIVEIGNRSFVKPRGWVYSKNYKTIDIETGEIKSGGSSCWWDESDFTKMNDPLLLLIIKQHKLAEEKRKNEASIRRIEGRLDSLKYAIRIAKGASS